MSTVARPRVLALIQAGGQGARMDVLTRETPKPALPFAGSYRLIDVVLSNLRNSDVSDVWMSVQFLGQQLADAVGNGKPWDLDRHHGGFKLIIPEQGAGSLADDGFVSGNAEELLQNRDAIRRHDPDAVIVLSADHVYRLDYRAVVAEHLAHDAECTVVTTEVSVADATHHAVIDVDDTGLVTDVAYKPDQAPHGRVATEVFVYAPGALIEVLEQVHRELANSSDRTAAGERGEADDEPGDGSALGDFGVHLLPALVRRGRTHSFALPGYWRDLGRPETYFAAHRELLPDQGLDLFDDDWPILTNATTQGPASIRSGASVENSLLAPGCRVAGRVRNSVLGPGVSVAAGATVRDSVLFADVRVSEGADVGYSIIDAGCVIGAVHVGRRTVTDEPELADLTLIGRDCRINGEVVRGARLEPGTVT